MDANLAIIIVCFVFWGFILISLVVTKYLGWHKTDASELKERITYIVRPPETHLSKLKNLNRTDRINVNQNENSVDLHYQLEKKVPSALSQNKVKELTK